MAGKRIGILTGGGDVPGLNSVIKSVVYSATSRADFDVVGIRRGWTGLTHLLPDGSADKDFLLPLNRENTRTVDRFGGTFLHTSRNNPSRMKLKDLPEGVRTRAAKMKEVEEGKVDMTPLILESLQRLRIDHLVAIGGDDTLSYAWTLHRNGFPVVAVPKTMDNDVQNTEYCIGFSTAMTRAVDAISRQRTTVGSHERIGVFRIFGRDAGFTALYTSYVSSVRCCIPEVPFDLDRLIQLLIDDKKNNPSKYALVVLAEGATWKGRSVETVGPPDAFGHRKKENIAEVFSDQLRHKTGEDTIVSDLTYDLRSGDPDFLDKMIATTFANMAFELVASGATGRMVGVRKGCYTDSEIPDPKLGPRKVDTETLYDEASYRPSYERKSGLPIFLTRV